MLENRLKPDSKGIINQLSDASVRTIMVTGITQKNALLDLLRAQVYELDTVCPFR